jgi:Leucine-rich repeat (LRR) protein
MARIAGFLFLLLLGLAITVGLVTPLIIGLVTSTRQQRAIERLRTFRAEVIEDPTTPGRPIAVRARRIHVDEPMIAAMKDVHNFANLELSEGSISDAAMEALPLAAPNLKALALEDVSLSDAAFSHINELPKLEHLTLSGHALSEKRLCLLTNLRNLTRLRAVYPRDPVIVSREDCLSATRFPKLEWLGLAHVHVTENGASGIATLPLKQLSLPKCSVDKKGFAQLERVSTLEILELSRSWVEDDDLEPIGRLPRLHALNLRRCAITDRGIAGLKSLDTLDVRNTPITDASVNSLRELTGLILLHAEDTEITDTGREALLKSLPNLNIETGKTERPS